jgi:hypothetical protein
MNPTEPGLFGIQIIYAFFEMTPIMINLIEDTPNPQHDIAPNTFRDALFALRILRKLMLLETDCRLPSAYVAG